MGMFNVNMPIVYGEGAEKAFYRLQEAILEKSNDHSILAWSRCSSPPPSASKRRAGLRRHFLAPDPWSFNHRQRVITLSRGESVMTVTHRVPEISAPTFKKQVCGFDYAILNCRFEGCLDGQIGTPLIRYPKVDNVFSFMLVSHPPVSIPFECFLDFKAETIVLRRARYNIFDDSRDIQPSRYICCLSSESLLAHCYEVVHLQPRHGVNT